MKEIIVTEILSFDILKAKEITPPSINQKLQEEYSLKDLRILENKVGSTHYITYIAHLIKN